MGGIQKTFVYTPADNRSQREFLAVECVFDSDVNLVVDCEWNSSSVHLSWTWLCITSITGFQSTLYAAVDLVYGMFVVFFPMVSRLNAEDSVVNSISFPGLRAKRKAVICSLSIDICKRVFASFGKSSLDDSLRGRFQQNFSYEDNNSSDLPFSHETKKSARRIISINLRFLLPLIRCD